MPLKYSLFTLKIASFRNGLVGLEIVGYQLYIQNYDDFCLEVTIFKVFFWNGAWWLHSDFENKICLDFLLNENFDILYSLTTDLWGKEAWCPGFFFAFSKRTQRIILAKEQLDHSYTFWTTVFPRIVSAETILFWNSNPKVTVHKAKGHKT